MPSPSSLFMKKQKSSYLPLSSCIDPSMPEPQDATERSPLIPAPSSSEHAYGGHQQTGRDSSVEDAEQHQQPEEAESPDVAQAREQVKYLLPVLGLGIFLAFLDQSVVAAINGDIGSDLHALRSVSWIATSYFLSMTCVQPLYGKLSDVFGRKPCLLFAYAMFGLGSLGCGLTKNMEGLIAARAIQGVGGGGMLIVVTVLLSDLIPLRDRGTYQGYLNLIGALGSTSGGPVGGLFAQSIGWRWVFLIQVVLCLVAIVCVGFLLHVPQRKSDITWRQQIRRIDFLGALLLILSLFAPLFGLDRGAHVSWRDPATIVSLCVTVPLVSAFLWVETRFAVEPFTPGHIIFDRALFACYAQSFFGYAGFMAIIFYIPFFFQVVLEMTPAQAGAGLIPAAISGVVGTLLGGIAIKRMGKFYWLALVSVSLGALASIPIALAPAFHSAALIIICIASVVSFVPQGITVTASLIAIISNVSAADQAVATACSFLFRSLGAAIGVSLIGLVIDQVLGLQLRAALGPEVAADVQNKIKDGLDFLKDLPPDLRTTIRDCYGSGIQSGFVMCSALLAISALCVIWWREKKISK
ncbi:MAG: hypothetical protein LQ346_006409 [Caloplaca aetnensis]|nr:MAG: hypothetical protein LQ346_006409 [Caloplaca aetnensis]